DADITASLWAARLDGSSLSTADREELDRWLDTHPSHRALLSQYCQFGADLERTLAPLRSQEDQVLQLPAPIQRKPWRRVAFTTIAAAAVWLVLAVVLPDRTEE